MGKTKGGSSKKSGVPRLDLEKGKGKVEESDFELLNEVEPLVEFEPLIKKRGPRKPKIPNDVYIAAFNKCEHVQARWVDKSALESLGILEDVKLVLKNIGLQDVLGMDHLSFPKEVSQLMGSFELKVNHKWPRLPIEDLGFVRFFVNGFGYKLTLQKLCEAYGFHPTTNNKIRTNKNKDALVWSLIGKGVYTSGGARSAHISNPAVRFVHRILATTLYARKEKDRIKEDEMALLTNGIKPLFKEECASHGIEGYEDVNLGIILAQRILYLKNSWVLSTRNKSGKLYIGGFLTPLLVASGVPLGIPNPRPQIYLDIHHLVKTSFISGKDGDKFVYHFINSKEDNALALLPNREITRLDCIENLRFLKGEETTNEEAIELEPLERRKRGKRIQGMSSQQGVSFGSSRYHHPSYQGRVTSEATKHALEGVKKNQRCNRWHSRALHNVKSGFKRRIKGLEDTISDLKSIVETFVLRKKSPPRYEDGSTSYGLALEEARRHSISHLPSHSFANVDEPSRASSYENQAPRRRRHRHIPTPSPPSSDNTSFHLSDSYSEG